MVFGSRYQNKPLKILGVILDTNLSYEEHITKTVSSWIECLVSVKWTAENMFLTNTPH